MSDGEVKFSTLSPIMQGILVLLTILGIVVPSVLGFVNFDKRIDIVETTTTKHIVKDEQKWDKIDGEMDTLKDDVHALELIDREILAHYQEIIRRFDRMEQNNQRELSEIKAELKQWEPVNAVRD